MDMSVKHFTINLEHDIDEHYQYQPGEILRGSIQLSLSSPTLLRTIMISVLGEGRVCWEDNQQQNQASEIYMDASKLIMDMKNTEPLSLNAGPHNFPFDYQLPYNLPSSFIGKYGNVTYVLKAIISGDRVGETNITSEPFLIVRPLPLSAALLKPKNITHQKKAWKGCTFGKILMDVTIKKSGLVPGEDILIDADITNRSPKVIYAIQASLLMNSTYHAQKKSISFLQVVNKRRDEYEMGYCEGRKWRNVRLAVPPYIPESNLDYCDLIEVEYSFQFKLEMADNTEMRIDTPITIGMKPQGLEVPENAQEREKAQMRNTRWMRNTDRNALGSDDFNHEDEILSELNHKTNSWHVGGAEITQVERKMVNPLFEQNDDPEQNKDEEIMEVSRL
ncbi:arrestin domain-containing protein 1 [Octopus sinensis]|uniref:Arrestin domain-containing protein 1 n=1 Tax=Octopus sinensis TaxID=2607531 RepID=A0A6P7TDK1_9MOLL|nr:arrestin domain-containing protein 1 [Octopus sinensis]